MAPKLTDEQLAELKSKHGGELTLVSTVLGEAVFRAPTPQEYERFVDGVSKGTLSKSISILARTCVVHPSREEFGQWLDKKPGIPADCAPALQELAGVTGQAETKKL